MTGQRSALARLSGCLFDEPLGLLLVALDNDAAQCLAPGKWVHAVGSMHFLCPQFVGALECASCEPLRAEDWGGDRYVGAEDMVAYHWVSTCARVMSPWRSYDVPDGHGRRRYGYTADVALPSGLDGTRGVLHWSTGSTTRGQGAAGTSVRPRWGGGQVAPGCANEPPALAVGDLVHLCGQLHWEPYTLTPPLPPRTPILELWDAANVEVARSGDGAGK
jgi:hypothetical protein